MNKVVRHISDMWTVYGLFIFAIGLTVLLFIPASADQSPEIDQNQGVSEFRSDGVEIIHNEDGSKLYRATMHDGISTSDDIR